MQKFQDNATIPINGFLRIVPGAICTIVNTSGGSSQMYSDNGITPIASATSDSNGLVSFYANDGTYTLTATGGGGTTTRTIQLSDEPSQASQIAVINTKLTRRINVKDYGAVGDGVTNDSVAITSALAVANNKALYFPYGTYLLNTGVVIPSNFVVDMVFDGGAKLIAGTNGMTVFTQTNNWYNSKVIDAYIDGNGKTGVIAFDLSNFRAGSSALIRPKIYNCDTGIYFRSLCWSTVCDSPYIFNTANPIIVKDSGNTLQIRCPQIDTFTGIGIDIVSGPTYTTVGVEVLGGYIQGGATGIRDKSFASKCIGTYFERCTVSDISLESSSYYFTAQSTNHTSTGVVCYMGRNADSAYIRHPFMSSGGRSTGLFDFDGTNTHCIADYILGNGSTNTPVGITTGLSQTIPVMTSGTFTPTVDGTTTAGAGTYSVQTGNYTKIGNVLFIDINLTWSAHTGTGNMVVSGCPFTGMVTQANVLTITGTNLTFTNSLYALVLNSTQLGIRTFTAGAGDALVALDTAAGLRITGSIVIH